MHLALKNRNFILLQYKKQKTICICSFFVWIIFTLSKSFEIYLILIDDDDQDSVSKKQDEDDFNKIEKLAIIINGIITFFFWGINSKILYNEMMYFKQLNTPSQRVVSYEICHSGKNYLISFALCTFLFFSDLAMNILMLVIYITDQVSSFYLFITTVLLIIFDCLFFTIILQISYSVYIFYQDQLENKISENQLLDFLSYNIGCIVYCDGQYKQINTMPDLSKELNEKLLNKITNNDFTNKSGRVTITELSALSQNSVKTGYIHSLNTSQISNNRNNKQLNICMLCTLSLEKTKQIFTLCGHRFHEECLAEKMQKDECPRCQLVLIIIGRY